jgi:hypothetical protein
MKLPKAIGDFDMSRKRWSKETTIWLPEIGAEQRFEVDRLKAELDLEERARTDARKAIPSANDVILNEPQLAICNRVFSGIVLLNQFLADELGKALTSARSKLVEVIDEKAYAKKVKIEVDTSFADDRPEINLLAQNFSEADRNLRYFKSANKLKRAASYRESYLMPVGIIMALLVLESVFNGILFKDVVRGGWIEGIFVAALISLINVAFGVAVGVFGWSNIGHVRTFRRVLGWLVTIVIHILAFLWNLLVAHFREVAEKAASDATYSFNFGMLAEQTKAHINTEGFFGISSLFAWALLGLGLAIHFYAAREGWDDIGDRYPDYMKEDRRAKLARLDRDQFFVSVRANARSAAEKVAAAAEQELLDAKSSFNAISDLEGLLEQREKEVRDSEDEWVAGGTQLLKIYRDVNLEVRGDSSPPAYFETYPNPDDYRKANFGAGALRGTGVDEHLKALNLRKTELSNLKLEAEQVMDKSEAALVRIRDGVNEALETLDSRMGIVEKDSADKIKRENQRGADE